MFSDLDRLPAIDADGLQGDACVAEGNFNGGLHALIEDDAINT